MSHELQIPQPAGQLARLVRRAWRAPTVALAYATVVIMGVLAVLAPLIAPQNPYDLMQIDIMDNMLPPMETGFGGIPYLLGTDDQGRDILSGILYGLRISLFVGLVSGLIALLIGTCVGLTAAYFGGFADSILMRIVDVQLSVPSILVALVLIVILGNGVGNVVLALVFVQWAYFARAARSAAMVERVKDYVQAARGLRLGNAYIMFREILPNSMPPLLVIGSAEVAGAIRLEATLSFLGLGLPVTEPSLGLMIANGYQYMLTGEYWLSMYPGIALLVAVAGLNTIGDHLRDVLDPRRIG